MPAGNADDHHPLSKPPQQQPRPPAALASRLGSKLAELRTGGGGAAEVSDGDGTLSPLSLSDEELGGVERLVQDPDSPTSRLMEQAARRSLAESVSRKGTPEKVGRDGAACQPLHGRAARPLRFLRCHGHVLCQYQLFCLLPGGLQSQAPPILPHCWPLQFSFAKDIACNPELAKAARAELLGSTPPRSSPLGGGGFGSGGGGGVGGLQPYMQHDAEIDRQVGHRLPLPCSQRT